MLAARAAGGGGGGGRALGDHPDGGPIIVRAGRFGAYVNWGKVNATIPKSISPEKITLDEAIELIAEREGRPAGASARRNAKPKTAKPSGKKAPAKKAGAAKAPAPSAPRAKTAAIRPAAAKGKTATARTKRKA